MKRKQLPETPPMTAKEIRELLVSKPDKSEAQQISDELKTWYFANCHLLTIGEDVAFKKYIGALAEYALGA
jgi:hypothetical protein